MYINYWFYCVCLNNHNTYVGAYAVSIQNSTYGSRLFTNEDLKDIGDYKNGYWLWIKLLSSIKMGTDYVSSFFVQYLYIIFLSLLHIRSESAKAS